MVNKDTEKNKVIGLTDKQNKKLDFFISTPLRSANRLMKQLYTDDHFYETATHAWVGESDAKKLFLYGVCKEVIKSCVGLMNDKEFVQEIPDRTKKKSDRMEKIIIGGIVDTQTYHIRKMIELLSLLILFNKNTRNDKEYRIFLSAENLDFALSRQQDFRDLYDKRNISNTQHSIDDYAKRIQEDLKELGLQQLWFLSQDKLKKIKKLEKLKPSIFESKKKLFLDALLVANADERLALGISYGRGYSRTSQAVHPLLGSHDYGRGNNNMNHVITNISYLSIICMHIMHLAYKIAGINDPEGLTKIMGENFEKSEASKSISQFSKELEVGDLILTAWTDIAEIIEEHTSKYGYKAYKIKYLLKPPLPEFPEDWIESSNILVRLMTKGWIRSFFEKNTNIDKMPEEIKEIWPKVMKQSDEDLMRSVKHFFVDMHKHGVLIPMLIESGFLKKREEIIL